MKKLFLIPLFVYCLLSVVCCYSARACGHEGWYTGGGYSQLFQFSPDHQLTGGGIPSPKINWETRWGGYAKLGYDFCGSRWGVEVPFSWNRQRLNHFDNVSVIGIDANAIFHVIETEAGADFYLTGGSGMNIVTEGTINDNSGDAGVNFNFGPGFQYFVSKKPRVAIGIAVPVKYTLYFGNHLSRNHTSVFGVPVQVGFTIGF